MSERGSKLCVKNVFFREILVVVWDLHKLEFAVMCSCVFVYISCTAILFALVTSMLSKLIL